MLLVRSVREEVASRYAALVRGSGMGSRTRGRGRGNSHQVVDATRGYVKVKTRWGERCLIHCRRVANREVFQCPGPAHQGSLVNDDEAAVPRSRVLRDIKKSGQNGHRGSHEPLIMCHERGRTRSRFVIQMR